VMICIPEFNKNVELLEKVCAKFDLQPRGSAGEHSAAEGAKFDVSNKQRIGFSEVELVQKMIDGVSKVIELEEMLAAGATAVDIECMLEGATKEEVGQLNDIKTRLDAAVRNKYPILFCIFVVIFA